MAIKDRLSFHVAVNTLLERLGLLPWKVTTNVTLSHAAGAIAANVSSGFEVVCAVGNPPQLPGDAVTVQRYDDAPETVGPETL